MEAEPAGGSDPFAGCQGDDNVADDAAREVRGISAGLCKGQFSA